MKNPRQELLIRLQRQYHRNHPWRLNYHGLYIPHSYDETQPDDLSWWDDVGFILNDRRVMVWWQHPRNIYKDAIHAQSWIEAGADPEDDWMFDGAVANYKPIGKSRKKIVSYTSRQPSAEQKAYYEKLDAILARLKNEGLDLELKASWKRERLSWATGVSLVAPLEVRSEIELAQVAALARKLLLGQTTMESEFPDYRYGKNEWIKEQQARTKATLIK